MLHPKTYYGIISAYQNQESHSHKKTFRDT